MSCTSPSAVLVFRKPGNDKWQKLFFKNGYKDEDPYKYLESKRIDYLRKGYEAELYQVGCGNCLSCRMKYSHDWAGRCSLESLMYPADHNYFVTLTYEDSNLHYSSSGLPSLYFSDTQLWMKNFRRYMDYHYGHDNIRFYMAGEYGDSTARPHYHFLIFNTFIPDLKLIGHNKLGDALYTSRIIEDTWNNGLVCIGEFNWNTAAYTARYVLKKHKGFDGLIYDQAGLEHPFTNMSRKPGIAVPWMMQYGKDLFTFQGNDLEGFPIFKDSILLPSSGSQPHYIKPPRIFEKYSSVDELNISMCKEMRQRLAEMSDSIRRSQVMESDRVYFDALNDIRSQSASKLIRKFQDLS